MNAQFVAILLIEQELSLKLTSRKGGLHPQLSLSIWQLLLLGIATSRTVIMQIAAGTAMTGGWVCQVVPLYAGDPK
jgi:hypothetical protein